eukprot:scaffold44033_cov50-Phaeocystis_antarctica.AAC.1
MRCSRQPSSLLPAANLRAVSPSYGGAAAAPHAVSGGGEGGATGGEDGWLAPLAMTNLRQSSSPLLAAFMRAVMPSYGGAVVTPNAVSGGGEGGATGGKDGGRGAEGVGSGWQGGAHLECCIHVHPLLHEAGEGGEVALARRIEKVLLRLRAQPPAVSASIAGARGRGAVWGG